MIYAATLKYCFTRLSSLEASVGELVGRDDVEDEEWLQRPLKKSIDYIVTFARVKYESMEL